MVSNSTMLNNHKTTNKYLALAVFFISLIVYTLTMAPTASFWDAGEFIAVAYGLEVNHPPGAPLYSLLGRIVSMFMPTAYVAASINFISALTSALTVMFLYLIIVRLIREWRGHPDDFDVMDKIGMYGGALVGSLTFAVTDTFWFNAVEAEVYALSMFFTAAVVWLALKWAENHDEPYNERWLVLIAYMFGLAIGVHLLNLLALFFVALIFYFKKREFAWPSFMIMGGISVVAFFLIYPFTIQTIPDLAGSIGRASYGLIGPAAFVIIIFALMGFGIYYTQKNGLRTANIVIMSYLMILIGYSSYSVIFIRSIADPPIDENDPETVEDFVKYLKREQYGSTPILKGHTFSNATGNIDRSKEVYFPRRYSPSPQHLRYYNQFNSDWEFFWEYQVNHMYIRYFNWNFIGRVADIQDTGWQAGFTDSPYSSNKAHNSYFFIPLFLGLFGMLFHFTSDWKRAFAVLTLFIVTGLAIIVFLNQTPYQPRERDYAYVGSFFAFSIWIGIGVTGLVDYVKTFFKHKAAFGYAIVGLTLLASPLWMGYQNWDDHDRSKRYVAVDYAANLLNSLAPNALVFTNGDNDTFPLWYAQEVEGIRTDVRVVCLSLLNTDWYIRQLRDQWSHESAPLPISLTDEEVAEITSTYTRWEPKTITVPVNKEMLKEAFSEDPEYKEAIGVKPDTTLRILQTGTDFEMPVDSLDDALSWYYAGRSFGQDQQGNEVNYLQTQDALILDIIETNKWLRPIYFANTVSRSSQLGLQDYFRQEGKAYRLIPKNFNTAPYAYIDPEITTNRYRKFQFRKWNHPDNYVDENIRRMMGNYRYGITQLADQYRELGEPDSAAYWLKWGEERIPFREDEMDMNSPALYAYRYSQLGQKEDALRLADYATEKIFKQTSYDFNRFMNYQDRLLSLNDEAQQARGNADMGTYRQISQQMQSVADQRDTVGEEIGRSFQLLIITQNIYFSNEEEEKAREIASRFDEISQGQYPMPATLEENQQYINQFGLN